MINALPFRLVSQLDQKKFADNLHGILTDWAKNWFQTNPGVSLSFLGNERISFLSDDKWLILGEAPDLWIAWKHDGGTTRDLLRMMFNSPVGSSAKATPLMQEILKECVIGFAESIFGALGLLHLSGKGQTTSLSSLRTNTGSGMLLGELQGEFPRQVIAFGGDLVERMISLTESQPSYSRNLASRESAIGNYKASVNVIAGHAELTLSDLANLEVGDVIRLDASVLNPFEVCTAEGLSIAKAHLGIRGDYKAIQLIED